MAHLLLMIENPAQRRERTPAEGQAVYERMVRWGEDLKRRGLLQGAESLKSTDGAARVTVRAGKAQVVDGPFSEAKEMVGGYFLVNTDTREQALALAAECPAAEWLTVEVRELAPCFV